ncbi:MAG: TonB-dependent receptor plug domain-containing protein, partial [Porphyrobacter sp.]|nr:TonB-dependent receptor plug domain-containing protein [Porphyrobacter sp.]
MHPISQRTALLVTTAFLTLAPAAAHAETDPGDDVTATTSDTAAQSGESANDIIVAARRRSESAQDVPIAVTVLGAQQIAETGAFNIGRLQQLAPTLQLYSSNPRNTSLNIRGLGVPFGLTSDGFEQGVGIYIDDVYYSRVAAATFDFLDVAQVEVLRGPQGTLYGKNTTAGAVNIRTNQPTFTFEGNAEVSLGNYEFKQARAAVSGPLSETLAVRVAASLTDRRGTIVNVTSREDIQSLDNIGVRAQLLWQPADTLKITLSGDYNKQEANCCGSVFVRTVATQRPLNRQFAALAAALNYAPPSLNPFDRVSDLDSPLRAGNVIAGAA